MDTILATYDAGTFLRLFNYNQNPQKLDEVFSYKTAQGTKYYPHTDMLGSVMALSDSTGTSQASWSYDVYGTRTQTSGSLSYAFGFTGREHDGDTGLIYSRQRYYDPSVGQWLSPDRKKMVNGPNLYGYVGDRPTLFSDPTGLEIYGPGPNGEVQLPGPSTGSVIGALLVLTIILSGGVLAAPAAGAATCSSPLVYGPSAGGALAAFAASIGGQILNEFGGPFEAGFGSDWLAYSISILNQAAANGQQIIFDLTNSAQSFEELAMGAGEFGATVTAGELQYILSNWPTFEELVTFIGGG